MSVLAQTVPLSLVRGIFFSRRTRQRSLFLSIWAPLQRRRQPDPFPAGVTRHYFKIPATHALVRDLAVSRRCQTRRPLRPFGIRRPLLF